jgi:starch-binding outer membrane protein SusE/F
MTYYKLKIFSTILLAAACLFACEEEGDKVFFQGGSSPVLTVSTTEDVVLNKSQENFNSLQFQWTNPSYEFSNGISTQDVYYTLEVDTAGSNFSNPVSIPITKELATSFKVKDLNAKLSGLELKDFVPHDFEFRVKASLANGSVPVYSNVVGLTITTYLDVIYPVPARLFITGAATPKNWMGGGDAPEPTQEFTKVNAYTFVIESLEINPSSGFLFVPVYGDWSAKYGFTGAAGANSPKGDSFKPDGNDFMSPAEGKAYKITVNFKTGKYSFE